jgi:phenylpyruvate tautomerase PptA (4-oxalocrotonate tautomerase family)
MPLIRIDMIEGRGPDAIKSLLEATHRIVVEAFKVPLRDRYQIVHEHPPSHFIAEDTGLGIARTRACVIFQLTTRPHERVAKETFYKALVRELETTCGVSPSDVIVSIVTNSDEDWSFGYGRAQYLTGELTVARRAS